MQEPARAFAATTLPDCRRPAKSVMHQAVARAKLQSMLLHARLVIDRINQAA